MTASFAQVSCSWPRKAAAPVNGVTIAIFSVPLQLTLVAAADVRSPPLAVLTATAATSVTSVKPIHVFI